jgi:predicted transcriptional regulator
MDMTKKKAPDTGRIPKMVYLPPDVARRLAKAAGATDLSQSTYMVQALKAQFKKDGIE